MIAREPKRGILFSLLVSTFTLNKFLHQLFCYFLQNSSRLWHNKLGHPNASTKSTLFKYVLLNKPFDYVSFECDACKLGKSKTSYFPHSTTRSTECFDLIHSDVWHCPSHFPWSFQVLCYVH